MFPVFLFQFFIATLKVIDCHYFKFVSSFIAKFLTLENIPTRNLVSSKNFILQNSVFILWNTIL